MQAVCFKMKQNTAWGARRGFIISIGNLEPELEAARIVRASLEDVKLSP